MIFSSVLLFTSLLPSAVLKADFHDSWPVGTQFVASTVGIIRVITVIQNSSVLFLSIFKNRSAIITKKNCV